MRVQTQREHTNTQTQIHNGICAGTYMCIHIHTATPRHILKQTHTHAQTHREMQVTCEDMNTHKDTDSHTYCDTLMSRYAR